MNKNTKYIEAWRKEIRDKGVDEKMSSFYDRIERWLNSTLDQVRRETADHYEQAVEASYYDLKPNNDAHAYVQRTRKRLKELRESLLQEGKSK